LDQHAETRHRRGDALGDKNLHASSLRSDGTRP
jgi:hypothetical protein